jgi:LacI family transcriptional regulator
MAQMLLSLINGTPAAELQELWQPVLQEGATVGPVTESQI